MMTTSPKLIGLDLDGVVFDFVTHFTSFINNRLGKSFKPEQVTSWHWHECLDITEEQFIDCISAFHAENAWVHTEFYPEAIDAIKDLIANDFEIVIISNRKFDGVAVGFRAICRLLDEIESLGMLGFVTCDGSKLDAAKKHGIKYFIEDKPSHAEEVATLGIPVYFVRLDHNAAHPIAAKNIVSVASLREAADRILKKS